MKQMQFKYMMHMQFIQLQRKYMYLFKVFILLYSLLC